MNGIDSSLQGRRWNSARNRERNQARFEIRERIASVCSNVDHAQPSSLRSRELRERAFKDEEKIRSFFTAVSKGSASFFSLKAIATNYELLSNPHDSDFMSKFKIQTLCTSRFGKDYADAMLLYKEKIETCTILEYASLIGEYGVVSSLVNGGINPFNEGYDLAEGRKVEVSKLAMQKLVADLVPKSLSCYVMKCMYTMKMWSTVRAVDHSVSEFCPICRMNPSDPLFCFPAPCNHKCCELCVWQYTLVNMDKHCEGDVFRCPTCAKCSKGSLPARTDDKKDSLTPLQRKEKSLSSFHMLPKDTRDLKKMPKRPKSKNVINSSWHTALLSSIGNSQDVRRDKFARYIDIGAFHHCSACLQSGIDVDMKNEYNQTPLYIACWRNHLKIVQLLLEFGANPHIAANGDMTAINVARENGHDYIVDLIESYTDEAHYLMTLNDCFERIQSEHISKNIDSMEEKPKVEILISADARHPGAGSCFIENALPRVMLKFLDELWSILPLATEIKKKKNESSIPCSDRNYFCDSEGFVCSTLEKHIESALNDNTRSLRKICANVFPQMRFLHYKESGSILAPHVDLSKIDSATGKRSTHTFILYLRDCMEGGETSLLDKISLEQQKILAKVSPRRGRLLLFPHACPHEGSEVISTPKLLLRGEVLIQ